MGVVWWRQLLAKIYKDDPDGPDGLAQRWFSRWRAFFLSCAECFKFGTGARQLILAHCHALDCEDSVLGAHAMRRRRVVRFTLSLREEVRDNHYNCNTLPY